VTALPGSGLPVRRVERADGGRPAADDRPATIPAARILQLDENGYRGPARADLDLVAHYRRFLDAPQRDPSHVPTDD
jgi:hypothetical protein